MDALTDIFIELNYDFKAFLSILYNTEAYQMSVNGKEQLLMKNYQIQGALLRRMTAEQLWDSMLTLAIGPKSIFKDDVHEKSFEYHDQRRDFMKKYVDDCIDIIQKHKGSEIYKGNVDELKDLVRLYIPKAKQFTEDYRLIESGSIPKLYAETKFPRIIPKGDFVTEMRRASDGGKREDVFVRLFGASDRSQSVHGGSSEANLVQPLELLNGETIREVTSKGSYIMKRIMMEESDKKKLEVLTYSLFSRKPSSQESSILKKHFSSKTQKGKSIVEKWQSYMIASMNSPEFIFIQ
jgi:hypothetical protein